MHPSTTIILIPEAKIMEAFGTPLQKGNTYPERGLQVMGSSPSIVIVGNKGHP